MSPTTAGDGAGGGPARVAADGPSHPGRITYADRVFTKIAEQAASQVIGVARGELSVGVARYRDGLALDLRTPLPVPSLDDRASIDAGPPVLERVAALQERVRDRVGELTGRDVVRLDVTVTGALTAARRRVR